MIDWETISGHQSSENTHTAIDKEERKLLRGFLASSNWKKINFPFQSLDRTFLIALRGEIFRGEAYIIRVLSHILTAV